MSNEDKEEHYDEYWQQGKTLPTLTETAVKAILAENEGLKHQIQYLESQLMDAEELIQELKQGFPQ